MGEYKVSFRLFGAFEQSEIVEAETIFEAEKWIKEKYGEANVKISTVASTKNTWC